MLNLVDHDILYYKDDFKTNEWTYNDDDDDEDEKKKKISFNLSSILHSYVYTI